MSSLEELLTNDGSVTMNSRNLEVLARGMFQVYNKFSCSLMEETFLAR